MSSNPAWASVDSYFEEALGLSDAVLDGALARSTAEGLPAIAVTPTQGKFLQLLARIANARRILEIGTLGGYSTICMARALPADGQLVTLEIDAHHADVARRNIEDAGLGARVEIIVGPAAASLSRLIADKTSPFDFVFVDADKASSAQYFELALQLSHTGTVIVVDNVVRNGAVTDASSTDPNIQGIRRMVDLVNAEPRVTATALQTVGAKDYDGFLIARVGPVLSS